MKFSTFLTTRIFDELPIEKLKKDLGHFKKAFNYAAKSQELYDNLIDNVMFIIQSKYGKFDIIYRENTTMYNELLLTITPQIPQFLMIQKKQLLENLDTFATLNNWGDVLKDNIKRDLNLSSTGENRNNFVPIDGDEKDPYSVNDVVTSEKQGEETNISRNTTNYLEFYKSIKWNIASIELEKILKPYIRLFKVYYFEGVKEEPEYDKNELEVRVENIEHEIPLIKNGIEVLGDELDKTNAKVGENTNSINLLHETKADKNDVYTKTESNELFATNDYVDIEFNNRYTKNDVYTKSECDVKYAKLSTTNSFTSLNNFSAQTNFYGVSTFSDTTNLNSSRTFFNQIIQSGWSGKTVVNKEYVDNYFQVKLKRVIINLSSFQFHWGGAWNGRYDAYKIYLPNHGISGRERVISAEYVFQDKTSVANWVVSKNIDDTNNLYLVFKNIATDTNQGKNGYLAIWYY